MFSNLVGGCSADAALCDNTSSLFVVLKSFSLLPTALGKCFSEVSGLEKIRKPVLNWNGGWTELIELKVL